MYGHARKDDTSYQDKTYHLTAVRRMVFLCMPVYDDFSRNWYTRFNS